MQIQTSTATPTFSLRNLTLTTHGGSDCGGYNIWIEIDVGHPTCNTSIVDEYHAGDTLLWFGKYLGSCRSFHFETGLDMINFRVKTNSTNDFCPLHFFAFMENEEGITFKSDYMDDWHEVSKTNDKNHTARRTHGDFTLPIAGNFEINCTKMVNSVMTLATKSLTTSLVNTTFDFGEKLF